MTNIIPTNSTLTNSTGQNKTNGDSELHDHVLQIWQSALDAVSPKVLLKNWFESSSGADWLRPGQKIVVTGAGKASAAMAAALEELFVDIPIELSGLVNVPDDCVQPLRWIQLHGARAAGSNFPTERGVVGARQMMELFQNAEPDSLGICLLSGGGSALLPLPAPGLVLEDKLALTHRLHRSGATIQEMNTVRKHLSGIKGGQLGSAFRGAHLECLIISDVIGDPLEVIASGPTSADPSTFSEAIAILQRYSLWSDLSKNVRNHLLQGERGAIPETCKVADKRIRNTILGNNACALRAAEKRAIELGYSVCNLGSWLQGDTISLARTIADLVQSICQDHKPLAAPVCLLSGGETTVSLSPNHGKGGRNQEFVLALWHFLQNYLPSNCPNNLIDTKAGNHLKSLALFSAGTDGEDGPTDAAGAVVTPSIAQRQKTLGENLSEYLFAHNAYPFFERIGGLVKTGWTGTNVMDVRFVLIAASEK